MAGGEWAVGRGPPWSLSPATHGAGRWMAGWVARGGGEEAERRIRGSGVSGPSPNSAPFPFLANFCCFFLV